MGGGFRRQVGARGQGERAKQGEAFHGSILRLGGGMGRAGEFTEYTPDPSEVTAIHA